MAAGACAIDEKVAVGGNDRGVGVLFGEEDEAGVGEVHGEVAVFAHELAGSLHIIKQLEINSDVLGDAESGQAIGAIVRRGEQMKCFGKNRFAGDHMGGYFLKHLNGPFMVAHHGD